MIRRILDSDFLSRMETASLYIERPMNGYFGGTHKAPSYGSTVEFADFREYMPGDDIRRIDWNVYSRFEKYFIRLFVDERQLHTKILIDCSASMESGRPEKAAAALKAAAAFGYLSVKAMDRISFGLMNGGKIRDLCGTVTGLEAYYNAVAALESTDFYGDTEIKSSVTGCADPGYNDGLTIIISDFLTQSDWKGAVDYLIYRHREVLLVQILSPDEMSPGINGRFQLMDREAGDQFDLRNMKLDITRSEYEAYKHALSDYLEEIRSFCASRNVGYICAVSDEDIDKVLFRKGYETGIIR